MLHPAADGEYDVEVIMVRNTTASIAGGRVLEKVGCGGLRSPTPQTVIAMAADITPIRGVSSPDRLLRRVEEPRIVVVGG